MLVLNKPCDIKNVKLIDIVSSQSCLQILGAKITERASMMISWAGRIVLDDLPATVVVMVQKEGVEEVSVEKNLTQIQQRVSFPLPP
jgi:hypothetical protein